MRVSGPAFCIGMIVAAYWLRVLRLVFKARRQTGRAANFLPPETLGKILRIIWYPTVLLWIFVPLFVALTRHPPAGFRFIFYSQILSWVAVLVALAALAATIVCWRRMGTSWRMGIDPDERTQLIVSGPYAYIRHPIYALSSILMIASMLAVPVALMIAVGAVHLIFLQWEARREERYLLATQREIYGEYFRNVGRFVPRSFAPYRAAS